MAPVRETETGGASTTTAAATANIMVPCSITAKNAVGGPSASSSQITIATCACAPQIYSAEQGATTSDACRNTGGSLPSAATHGSCVSSLLAASCKGTRCSPAAKPTKGCASCCGGANACYDTKKCDAEPGGVNAHEVASAARQHLRSTVKVCAIDIYIRWVWFLPYIATGVFRSKHDKLYAARLALVASCDPAVSGTHIGLIELNAGFYRTHSAKES